MPQTTALIDETTLDVLQTRLYPRLEQSLLVSMRREQERVPPYYEQFVGSEIRRVEEGIEHLDRRIGELRLSMDQRFTQVDQRFDRVDQRFDQVDQRFVGMEQRFDRCFDQVDQRFVGMEQRFDRLETRLDEMNVRFRNWMLAVAGFLGILTTVLSIVLR